MKQDQVKLYFPSLDGVRAIAVLFVIVSHIELHKVDYGLARIPFLEYRPLGYIGVSIFFALSGFLITYLLLEERTRFGKVDYPHFYLRRILRIWPLYFLVLAGGFAYSLTQSHTGASPAVTFPSDHFAAPPSAPASSPYTPSLNGFLLSLFFLPNLAFVLKLLPPIIDPIWSIGTEEQFYIFHPHFFRIGNPKKIFMAMAAFLLAFVAVNRGLKPFDNGAHPMVQTIRQFMVYGRYPNMMFGALFAVLYYNYRHQAFPFFLQRAFNALLTTPAQIIALLVFAGLTAAAIHTNGIVGNDGGLFLAFLSSVLIVNLVNVPTTLYSLEFRPLAYLGRISYGLYLLHKIPMTAALFLLSKPLRGGNVWINNVVIYGTVLATSVALAAISYHGYESFFLSYKKKVAKIVR